MADDLLAAAAKYLPGGSSWMWSLPPDVRFVVERGEGSHIVDTTCGYSLGAIAGRADVMETANPDRKGGDDYACLSGTLSGNPLACAAGLAALDELARPGVYPRLHEIGRRLRTAFAEVAARRGVPLQALGDGPIVQPVFVEPKRAIRSDRDLAGADGKLAVRLGHELVRRGIFVIPGAKMYLSLAHTDADLDLTVKAFEDALGALSGEGDRGASRLRRDAPSEGGSGGHVGAPS